MHARSLLLLTVASLLISVPEARAQTQSPQKGERQAPLRDMFLDLDANNDRVIDPDEVPADGRPAFDRLLRDGDSNHNGKLETDEFRGILQKTGRSAAGGELALKRFEKLDKNGDGKLDSTELTDHPQLLDRLDRNGDGFIEKAELSSTATAKKPAKAAKAAKKAAKTAGGSPLFERFKAMDKDGDRRISRDEFTGRPAAFERLDTNHDGFLDGADRRGGLKS